MSDYLSVDALLKCQYGEKEVQLQNISNTGFITVGKPVVKASDCIFEKNIPSFGLCSITNQPCKANFLNETWFNTVQLAAGPGDEPLATLDSYLLCLTGKGIIFPSESGQDLIFVPEIGYDKFYYGMMSKGGKQNHRVTNLTDEEARKIYGDKSNPRWLEAKEHLKDRKILGGPNKAKERNKSHDKGKSGKEKAKNIKEQRQKKREKQKATEIVPGQQYVIDGEAVNTIATGTAIVGTVIIVIKILGEILGYIVILA